MCQDAKTRLVRAYGACPAGTYEVFPLIKSGGGGRWSKKGYWIGQVVPRVDTSPRPSRSENDQKALKGLLDRAP